MSDLRTDDLRAMKKRIFDLEEQLESARTHLINALNLAHPISGDDHDLMDEANRWLDAPNPASEPQTERRFFTQHTPGSEPGEYGWRDVPIQDREPADG